VIAVGLTLQPDDEYLELLAPLLRQEVDYFEVTPETTWWSPPPGERGAGELLENGFHRRFLELGAQTGRPFVAHGVGLSLGTASRRDVARRRRWLARLQEDQARFGYRWYSEHLGASSIDGQAVTLPLPLWMDGHAAATLTRRLRAMQGAVGTVGIENTAAYFLLGRPLDEARFLRRVLAAARAHLVLDLHNVHTMAENLGFAAADYLAQLELAQVIEIHVSGGSYSDGSWLPGGRSLRLDSHDAAVPEPVWRLLDQVLLRCPNLRGLTLERMEGTVSAADVPLIAEELRRLRRAGSRA
jgi:uncharacterized protein (UPF0276 family)